MVSFQSKSANSTSRGYAGLDFQQPSDVRGSINASQAIVFWGGLHHNIKEVQTHPEEVVHTCEHIKTFRHAGTYQQMFACATSSESLCSSYVHLCLLPPQAMDRHGLALERKPEVARVVMDSVAPALRLLQDLLALPMPAGVLHEQANATSAPFGGAQLASWVWLGIIV